ncbi:MAG: DUF3422 domain-containing protein [Gammaproteobacteria bacterium]|nr:DUF3422 domain-containing protein [Gammaproteobacteria bacterium]
MSISQSVTTKTEPLKSKVIGIPEYNIRTKLQNELHASPYELLSAPTLVSHLALFSNISNAQEELQLLTQLCQHFSVSPPALDSRYFSADFGLFRLRWERHNEFCSYTFFVSTTSAIPFSQNAIECAPKEWLASLPGEIISATHVTVEKADKTQYSMNELSALFASNNIIGAKVAADRAVVWTDNKIHSDGFCRILISVSSLSRHQTGRLVKRLIDIDTYRMLAMLPVPMAREYIPELARLDERLAELTTHNTELETLEDEQQLLTDLTRLAAEIESISVKTNQRFCATSAYYNIVKLRISELREQRIQGLQMFHEFMEQRLTSAMDTCASVHGNLDTLSKRVARASELLRTRVDITMEGQTRDLLQSMDKRAHLQFRLQQTVEGLSVVVLSYYLIGIVGYGLKGIKSSGLDFNIDIATGLSIPVVFGLVYVGVHRLRNRISKKDC